MQTIKAKMIFNAYIYLFALISLVLSVQGEDLCLNEDFNNGEGGIFDTSCGLETFQVNRYEETSVLAPDGSNGYFLSSPVDSQGSCITTDNVDIVENTILTVKYYVEGKSDSMCLVLVEPLAVIISIVMDGSSEWKSESRLMSGASNIRIQIRCGALGTERLAIEFVRIESNSETCDYKPPISSSTTEFVIDSTTQLFTDSSTEFVTEPSTTDYSTDTSYPDSPEPSTTEYTTESNTSDYTPDYTTDSNTPDNTPDYTTESNVTDNTPDYTTESNTTDNTPDYTTTSNVTDNTPDYTTESNTTDNTPDYTTESNVTDYTPDYTTESNTTESNVTDYTPDYTTESNTTDNTPDYTTESNVTDYTPDYTTESNTTDNTPDYTTESNVTDYTPDYTTESNTTDNTPGSNTSSTPEYSTETSATDNTPDYSTEPSSPDVSLEPTTPNQSPPPDNTLCMNDEFGYGNSSIFSQQCGVGWSEFIFGNYNDFPFPMPESSNGFFMSSQSSTFGTCIRSDDIYLGNDSSVIFEYFIYRTSSSCKINLMEDDEILAMENIIMDDSQQWKTLSLETERPATATIMIQCGGSNNGMLVFDSVTVTSESGICDA